MKQYVLEGDPIALARPRIGLKRFYDKQKHLKLVAGINLKNQHGNRPFYEGPLRMSITFYMPIRRKKDQRHMNGSPHYYKPDLSNLIKFIEDIGSGILYHDDALIYAVEAIKKYDTEPRTEFTVEEVWQ